MSLPPKIDFIGFTDSYNDTFALIVEWNAGLVTIFVSCVYTILKLIRSFCFRNGRFFAQVFKQTIQLQMKKDMELNEEKQQNATADDLSENKKQSQSKDANQEQTDQGWSCLDIFIGFFFYVLCGLSAFLVINLYMFNIFGRGKLIDISTFISVSLIFIIPITLRRYSQNKNFFNQQKTKLRHIIQVTFWILLSLSAVVMTKDICVCQFNTKYGVNLIEDSSLSTGFSRTMTLKTVCPVDELCHFYATLPQDGSNSVFFNVHSGTNLKTLTVKLTLQGKNVSIQESKLPYHFADVQSIGQRMIHSLMFYDLSPSTTYQVQVSDKNGKILKTTTYRTLPGKNASLLKMAIGGDVGLTQAGQKMTKHLIAYDPDVIVIGGDVAYDDGMRTCYYSWDNFYDMFENVFQKLNRVIPMIMSVGNHDVGYDALKRVHINKHPDITPLYFLFNPQNLGLNRTIVPHFMERDSVHYHLLGPVLMFNLDSGYLSHFQDQARTIRQISKEFPGYYRTANYHNPIYPSCADSNKDSNYQQVVTQGMLHWVPVFDQLNFTTVMEHHTHFRKMTYRLRNNTINNETGVRYIGDGSWGVPDDVCPYSVKTQRTQFLQNFTQVDPNHMWQVTLTRSTSSQQSYDLNYTSVNINGSIILTKIDKLYTPPT